MIKKVVFLEIPQGPAPGGIQDQKFGGAHFLGRNPKTYFEPAEENERTEKESSKQSLVDPQSKK